MFGGKATKIQKGLLLGQKEHLVVLALWAFQATPKSKILIGNLLELQIQN